MFRRKREEPAVDDGSGGWVAYAEVEPHLAELARLQQERVQLIELCLYARDRVASAAAAERVDAGLVELGVTPLRPDGLPFDPAQHEAAATVPTEDPALHGTVETNCDEEERLPPGIEESLYFRDPDGIQVELLSDELMYFGGQWLDGR